MVAAARTCARFATLALRAHGRGLLELLPREPAKTQATKASRGKEKQRTFPKSWTMFILLAKMNIGLIDKIFKQIRKKDRKREELEFGTSQLVFLYSEKDTSW